MDRPIRPVHSRGAEVAKHPTGVYLQVSCVQGEQASPFFFSFKKKGAKKNAPSGKDVGGVSPVATGDQGAALDLPPFEKGGPKL